jgi:catechol 2,3-dioxygenase-like lactoylglutathione lyase family enzyme
MNDLPRWTVNHVGLLVTDIEVMKKFYTDVMGFQVTDRGPVADTELMFLGRDPTDHHQIVLIPGRPEGSYNVVNHIALDFSQDDAAIDRVTRERFGDDPSFRTIEAWRQRAFGSEAAE